MKRAHYSIVVNRISFGMSDFKYCTKINCIDNKIILIDRICCEKDKRTFKSHKSIILKGCTDLFDIP
jgi:hypothetical protein